MNPAQDKSRFHRFQNRGQVAAWESHLNRRWPYRLTLVQVIQSVLANMTRRGEFLHIVEFATGPGMMAFHLLSRMPDLDYTGLDFSAPFVHFASRRMQRFGARARVRQADLNQDTWIRDITPPVDAFLALQSIHDLGDETHVARIYRKAFDLLAPDGCFLNADFVVPPGSSNDRDPGRLSVARHFALMQEAGFAWTDCLAREQDFACLLARKV